MNTEIPEDTPQHTEITPYLLLNAYAVGYFPMAEGRESDDIFWIDPDHRGIIPLEDFHLPKSFKRFVKKCPFKVTCNTDFQSVIYGCAAPTEKRQDTWINDTIMELFTELHHLGYAHSIEVWADSDTGRDQAQRLVGGLYGVTLGGAFFAESMFSRESEASKVALAHLVARLKYSKFQLLDTQFLNDHLKLFGGIEISRDEYKTRLTDAIRERRKFYQDQDDGWLLQSITQTS